MTTPPLYSSPPISECTVKVAMNLPTPPPQHFHFPLEESQGMYLLIFSGLHFGHYKAATSSHSIALLHSWFMQLIFMLGILLPQYQSALQQVFLEKKSGSINVDSLCTVLLREKTPMPL